MLSVLVLTVFLGIINHSIASFEYIVVDESLQIPNNSIFSLEISPFNLRTYFKIIKPISKHNTLCLNISAERSDGVKFSIVDNPVPLCDFLKEEATNSNNTLSELKFSRVIHMDGKRCPIPAGKVKLKPYMPPQSSQLFKDMGCGRFNFNVTLGNCKTVNMMTSTYLFAKITLDLQKENCSI